jgi:DNA invertase Pin-like site-specific DNA recombinase
MNQNNRQRNDEEKRDKIRRKYNAAERAGLEVKHARKEKNIFDNGGIMRVGVYCRVSTGNMKQLTSYIMQQKYYSEFVERHSGWVLIEIYADEGISGTSLNHRDEFLRMLKNCEDGKLDLIVVKSVSRFARCTEDFLKCIKDLANHKPPIGVFFENEGMYTLDESKQLTLTFLAGFAQEESHAKSTSMNSSLEQRFSHGIFLTPPLLGYDNDKDGNLIINKDEAETVRLIFNMYQYGHTCDIIADTLMTLGRKTKLGNTKWSSSTVRGVLQNERHCGDILARKTWTPNYLNHKSVKNRSDTNGEYDKNQYYKRAHHERIITRDDFIAVSHMMANAKYGGRRFMPELHVNSGGALHGFVSVNPRWGAFKTEDYRLASKSVGAVSRNESLFKVHRGEVDMRGYEIARTQFFNTANITSVTFSNRNARFSGECIRKLGGAEYIELLVRPSEKLFAVRKCSPEHRNAIRWANLIDDIAYTRQFGGSAFLGTLFEILGWNYVWRYRLRGAVRNIGGESVAFFNAQEAEIIIPRETAPSISLKAEYLADFEVSEYYIFALSKYRVVAVPALWQSNFGIPYYRQSAQNAQIDQAGTEIDSEHNAEPDIHPTPREILADNIEKILTKFRNTEAQNG